MGVCYSYQDQWQQQNIKVSIKKKNKKKRKKQASVIIQQRSSYGKSFASALQDQYRDSLHQTIDNLTNSSMLQSSLAMGSVLQMTTQQHQILLKNLATLNSDNPEHTNQSFRLCNFKTKNFLHTHKVKLQKYPYLNEVSCCPYNATHTLEYDIWSLQPLSINNINDQFYIYHPFTRRYLNFKQQQVVASQQKQVWIIHALGKRRNLGFVRIQSKSSKGWLCMTDQKALVKNHRQIGICNQMHISHLWEVIFTENV